MPHLILEYSANIAADVEKTKLLEKSHHALQATGVFTPQDLKSRAQGFNHTLVGNAGADGSFVHAWFYLLEGRTLEQKSMLADALFAVLQNHAPFADQISVDIHDMEKASYRKATQRA